MFLSKSSFTPSCQMRRLTANSTLMLHRWPGYNINLWTKLRTERKSSFWQRSALSGVSLALGWSQALISGSPLAQSPAKSPSLLPAGSSPDWQKDHHGQISHWNCAIHQSSRCPGFCTAPLGVCEVDPDEKVCAVCSCCSAADWEIQLRQIRWCVHFLHVFLMLSWFCKHYRWHVLRV